MPFLDMNGIFEVIFFFVLPGLHIVLPERGLPFLLALKMVFPFIVSNFFGVYELVILNMVQSLFFILGIILSEVGSPLFLVSEFIPFFCLSEFVGTGLFLVEVEGRGAVGLLSVKCLVSYFEREVSG